MDTGNLKKLSIKAYKDVKFDEAVGSGEFTTLLNPEKYVISYKPEYKEEQGQGTSATAPKFTRIAPQELDVELLFDSTGVLDGSPNMEDGIIEQIDDFKKIVFDYSGDEHKPYYLQVSWGMLLFKGYLTDMSIEFKLFAPDGTPLRAIAKLKLKSTTDENLRAAKENNQSSDLTHYRKVEAGDTLTLMTYRIYGDPKYYLEVAKVNKITNFRKLTPGQELIFPPIEKVS